MGQSRKENGRRKIAIEDKPEAFPFKAPRVQSLAPHGATLTRIFVKRLRYTTVTRFSPTGSLRFEEGKHLIREKKRDDCFDAIKTTAAYMRTILYWKQSKGLDTRRAGRVRR